MFAPIINVALQGQAREPLLRYERQPLLPPKVAARGYPHRYQS